MTRIVTPAARHVLDQPPELAARHRIDAARRLVEKDDARLVQDGAAERQPLTPAAGETRAPACSRARPGRPSRRRTSARRRSARRPARTARRRTGCSARRSAPRTARTSATCSRCAASPPPGSRLTSTPSTIGRARRRLQQPAQHADGRRLAGAVRAEKAEDLSPLDVEADAIDGGEAPNRRVRSRTTIAWSRGHRPSARSSRARRQMGVRERARDDRARPAAARPARRGHRCSWRRRRRIARR